MAGSGFRERCSSSRKNCRPAGIVPLTLTNGMVFDERYLILERLGEGGMGVVYKANETALERLVALKLLHYREDQGQSLQRFKQEGQILSSLSHANILHCHRYGVWAKTIPYIAMEYLDGVSLERLTENGMEPKRVVEIGLQICAAMDYAHQHGVIHRDLKPSNVVVLADENREVVKVLDFGLARLVQSEEESQHLTMTGALVGSIYYMSPEQCLGKKADARSDIYSLGCILYQAISGQPPLVADNPVGVMHQHVNCDPAPLVCRRDSEMVCGLTDVISRAMAKSPEQRYQSMAELKTDLELVQLGRGNEVARFVTENSAKSRQNQVVRSSARIIALLLVPATLLGCWLCISYKFNNTAASLKRNDPGKEFLPRSFPLTYCASGGDRAGNVAMLELWLKQHFAADDAGTAMAHFWLYVELCGNPQGAEIRGNDYLFQLPVFTLPAPENVLLHKKLSREIIMRVLSHSYKRRPVSLTARNRLIYALAVLDTENLSNRKRVEVMNDILQRYNDCLDLHLRRALEHAKLQIFRICGDYRAEENLLRKGAFYTLAAEDPMNYISLSQCLQNQGKFDLSRRVLNESIAVLERSADTPHDYRVHHASRRLMELNDADAAITLLKLCSPVKASEQRVMAENIRHDEFDHYLELGRALHNAGRYNEAAQVLERVSVLAGSPVERWAHRYEVMKNDHARHLPLLDSVVFNPTSDESLASLSCASKCVVLNPGLATSILDQNARFLLTWSGPTLRNLVKQCGLTGNTFSNLHMYNRAAEFLSTIDQRLAQESLTLQERSLLVFPLIRALAKSGKIKEAEERLSAIRKLVAGDESILFQTLIAEANLASIKGDIPLSIHKYEEALAICRDSYEVPISQKAITLERCAALYQRIGKTGASDRLLAEQKRIQPWITDTYRNKEW